VRVVDSFFLGGPVIGMVLISVVFPLVSVNRSLPDVPGSFRVFAGGLKLGGDR
jgi:hypothetical protein